MLRRIALLAMIPSLLLPLEAQTSYQSAPPEIQRALDAPRLPNLSVAPDGQRALLASFQQYPPVRDLARPTIGLAGLRVDPRTRAPKESPVLESLALLDLATGLRRTVALPKGLRVGLPQWSPDGRHFALAALSETAAELWIGDAVKARLRRVPRLKLNPILGGAFRWMPGSRSLLARSIPPRQGEAPREPLQPAGPRIQEHDPLEKKGEPTRTIQDLLKNAHDADLFEHLALTQLCLVDLDHLQTQALGRPALVDELQPSPDGKHLLVGLIHRPFSYLVSADDFPRRFEVWNLKGTPQKVLSDQPLTEGTPIGGVRTGPRALGWIPTEPATLRWIEALDGGDPKAKVDHRDRLVLFPTPFQAEPRELLRTEHRLQVAAWTETGRLLLREFDRAKNRSRTWRVDPSRPEAKRQLWDLSNREKYRHPGQPQSRVLPSGHTVVREEGGWIFLEGEGASPKGDHPFLDRLNLDTLESERIFQCEEGWYEAVEALLPEGRLITRRESPATAPNYLLRVPGQAPRALTQFQDPLPELRRIKKELVRYQRPDGVELSFTLYLPPDYKPGERRPALVWAYPLEFTDSDTAGQVGGSRNRFTQLGGSSHLFMLLKGYVVLDNATMPVVGDPETVNNTFLEQVVASAKAALDKASEIGVIDPKRVAVGGHSYGAFMTANLLAHSDLFCCGIARSGAYNRTLTPFGFQSERRTLWEAPEMYLKVSPFLKANHFKAPILLIHGEADNNPGTFPVQTERLYQALKGNNQAARYVTLPHESHGYRGRESVEHVLWEMGEWLGRHTK